MLTLSLSCRTDIFICRKSSHVAEQVPAFITLSDFSKRCTAEKKKQIKMFLPQGVLSLCAGGKISFLITWKTLTEFKDCVFHTFR